jgi:hypothetical protein
MGIGNHPAIGINSKMRLLAKLFVAVFSGNQAAISICAADVRLIGILAPTLPFSEIVISALILFQESGVRVRVISPHKRVDSCIGFDKARVNRMRPRIGIYRSCAS